ncbi:hypothetical protein P7K49_024183 [Saguinus oedipus]|uniref:Uncharacterized protein n=1 Tax=Saguinus oedipus TaxID=9490 RepID=A0ABQ9UNS6_SAGOE|nr:hypothetical protein P7K49_024183 [Saguinus oedipus]
MSRVTALGALVSLLLLPLPRGAGGLEERPDVVVDYSALDGEEGTEQQLEHYHDPCKAVPQKFAFEMQMRWWASLRCRSPDSGWSSLATAGHSSSEQKCRAGRGAPRLRWTPRRRPGLRMEAGRCSNPARKRRPGTYRPFGRNRRPGAAAPASPGPPAGS